jgi:hypothetical protein
MRGCIAGEITHAIEQVAAKTTSSGAVSSTWQAQSKSSIPIWRSVPLILVHKDGSGLHVASHAFNPGYS